MRLIDEDDAAASPHETALHTFCGLVRVLGDERCRENFDDFVFGKNSQRMEEPSDDTSYGGLAGARGALENHVHGGFRESAVLAQLYMASLSDIRKFVEITLVLEPDEGVQLLEDGGDMSFVGLRQMQECIYTNVPGAPGERSDPSKSALQVPVCSQITSDAIRVTHGYVVPQ